MLRKNIIGLRHTLLALVLMALCAFPGSALVAQNASKPITITKTAAQGYDIPTLNIKSLSGDAETARAVRSFLKSCGYFKVVENKDADYELNGTCAPGQIQLSLSFGGNPVLSRTFRFSGDARRGAAQAVDSVLEERFKARICDSRIAFAAETQPGIKAIYVCDIDGGNLCKLTDFKTSCVEPAWMPNANSVVYTRYAQSSTDICETMIAPWRTRRLTTFPGTNVGAAIHPGASHLALVMSVDHQVELYVKALNSPDKRRLTRSKAVEASPCWSPNGGTICFVSDMSGSPRLYTISPNGGEAKRLPTLGGEAVTPSWSKNNKIAYSAKINGEYKLAVYDWNGADSGLVPNLPAGNWESPAWAPDGRHVVASRRTGRSSELYVVDTKTGTARKLLSLKGVQSSPDWSNLR